MRKCPFCGEDEPLLKYQKEDDYETYSIRCEYCGAYGPPADTEDEAFKSWDKRAWWADMDLEKEEVER